jgi:hypothetical protein
MMARADAANIAANPDGFAGDVRLLVERLYGHVMAENVAEAADAALGHFGWEWRENNGSGRWAPFSEAETTAIEAERRGGRPGPLLTMQSGGHGARRLRVDFANMILTPQLHAGGGGGGGRGLGVMELRAINKSASAAGGGAGGAGVGAPGSAAAAAAPAAAGDGATCLICYCPFGAGDDAPAPVAGCGHRTACRGCFQSFVQHKLRSGDVLPWIKCPAEGCQQELTPDELCGCGCEASEVRA